MKFWKKLTLFIITMISIILACSRYYIVKNNFSHSIENSFNEHENQHILEKYMLETNIINEIQKGEEITNEKIIEYVKSLNSYMENNLELVFLYDENCNSLYSSKVLDNKLDIESKLNSNIDNYFLKKIDNNNYIVFISNLSINGKLIYIVNAYNINSLYEEKDRELKSILYTDIIILTTSIIVISIFSKIVTKPIDILDKIAKEIASGNFNKRVEIKSTDEIGDLAKSFNIMADEISKKINELNMNIREKNDFINRIYS